MCGSNSLAESTGMLCLVRSACSCFGAWYIEGVCILRYTGLLVDVILCEVTYQNDD